MRSRRSPASPSRTARTIGMPPATDASNSSSRFCRARQREQLDSVSRDELLVRRHDRFSGLQRAPDEIARRLEATHQLDDDVGVRRDDGIDAVGPLNAGRHPVDLLALDTAIADRASAAGTDECRSTAPSPPIGPTVPKPTIATFSGALHSGTLHGAHRRSLIRLILCPVPFALCPFPYCPGLIVTGSRNGIMLAELRADLSRSDGPAPPRASC